MELPWLCHHLKQCSMPRVTVHIFSSYTSLPLLSKSCRRGCYIHTVWMGILLISGSNGLLPAVHQVSLIGDFLFVQKSFPKWAKVLPEIKRIRGAQKKSNSHLSDLIPISYAQDHETGWFEYRPFSCVSSCHI